MKRLNAVYFTNKLGGGIFVVTGMLCLYGGQFFYAVGDNGYL